MRRTSRACLLLPLAALLPLLGAPGRASAGDILTSQKKIYSQFDEELIIRDFFQDRRDGFFVDVGCAWARKDSTTFYLEQHLGWSGIGVDANERYAESWRKNRPRSRFFNFLVMDHSGASEKFYAAQGLGSTQKDRIFKGKPVGAREVEVQSITLNDLLERSGVSKIDFLSMDIEGSEPGALAGFDIGRFRPELVCIEVMKQNREKILTYFTENGYERIDEYLPHDEINWYFKPKDAGQQ